MMKENLIVYESPIGAIGLAETGGKLTRLFWVRKDSDTENFAQAETPVLTEAAKQLAEYFSGTRKAFDLPLNPAGTDFHKTVWRELIAIPYGEVTTYGALAKKIGSPKACRAVGGANNRNPIALIIPCHRVVGHNNALTGFAYGLDRKQFLLDLERAKQSEIS